MWTNDSDQRVGLICDLVIHSKGSFEPVLRNDTDRQWNEELHKRIADHKPGIISDTCTVLRKAFKVRLRAHGINRTLTIKPGNPEGIGISPLERFLLPFHADDWQAHAHLLHPFDIA